MLKFYKYHGAGNDFIAIDDRNNKFNIKDTEKIKLFCHRQFGIGADGILLIRNKKNYDFEMVFINNDGSMGSMCGNGGRCVVHFAHNILKIVKNTKKVKFWAIDGEHEAEILKNGQIKLKMQDMSDIVEQNGLPFLYAGTTPHHIKYVENLAEFPVYDESQKVRKVCGDPKGVNINYVEIQDGVFHVRTYERGVENETLACGTGASSVAIASHYLGILKENICHIKQPGGNLIIEFEKEADDKYKNIYLTGPAMCVFEGEIKL